MKIKPKVFIASPYTKGDPVLNIQRAIDVAEVLVRRGYIPFCPHLSHLWHLYKPHPVGFWYDYDLQWIPTCDYLLRLSGESAGADHEVEVAERLGIMVIHSATEIPDLTR